MPVSTTKASTPKSRRVNGNSQVFGKGSKNRSRPGLDGALPPRPPVRKIRRGRELPLQAARQGMWIGTVPACIPTSRPSIHARSRREGILRSASWLRSINTRTSTSRCMDPDNHLRLTGLHEGRSPSTSSTTAWPTAAPPSACPTCFVNTRLPRLSGGSPSQLAGRPLPDRQPHPPDHRHRAPEGMTR